MAKLHLQKTATLIFLKLPEKVPLTTPSKGVTIAM